MDFTQIIALIGCITGVTSLLINLYNVVKTREKLKIKFRKNTNLFFDKLNSYQKCNTKYQAIICLDIINKSPTPTTVYQLKIKERLFNKENVNWWVFENDNFTLIDTYKDDWKYSKLEFDMTSKFDTPLKLQAYEVFSGCIFLPFFPDCEDKEKTLWLIFKTSRRIKIKKVKLSHFKTKYYNQETQKYDDTD